MRILGIESSCDETAAAIVEDGKIILSNIVSTQIPFHRQFNGVVPEIASRKHAEWILPVVTQALEKANMSVSEIDAVATTNTPGLMGSLLVGLTFGKTLAWSMKKPFVAINHMLAHLYAAHLIKDISYPYLGLLVSGGHTIICKVNNFDDIEVLGTTIDDAVGEAFDKVAKFYGFGYPGGSVIDSLAKNGNKDAATFPLPKLKGEKHRYDVSYSGLKTAVINQIDQFWNSRFEKTPENIAASFQEAAVQILLSRILLAIEETSISTIVAGGGVAANSRLRELLEKHKDINCIFPPLNLCGDNGAMIAGIAYQYLLQDNISTWTTTANARITMFKHGLNKNHKSKYTENLL